MGRNNRDLLVWVLNLERSKDRRHFMDEQLHRFALDYEIIKAVDGQELTPEELLLYSKKEAMRCCEREMSNGEIGCALSHARMWQRIIADEIDEVLILEDDVMIGEMMLQVLDCRHRLPEDWEFINFMTDVGQIPMGQPIYDIYRACRFEGYANRTSAYLINRKGVEKLLGHVYPIRWTADGFTGRPYITGLVSYGIDPRVAALKEYESEIWKDTNYFGLKRSFRAMRRGVMRKFVNALSFLCSRCHTLPR